MSYPPPIGHRMSYPHRTQDVLPHTPYEVRISEIRNANAVAPDDGAGQLDGAAWSGPKKSLLLPIFLLDAG